jgi:hypothetical protein
MITLIVTSLLCVCWPAGASLAQLPQLVPQLTSLDVSGCGGLSGDDLAQLLGQMKHLERLVLDGIEEVGVVVGVWDVHFAT